jgi:phasin family protein
MEIPMYKSFEDFQTYGKENMDAYVASAQALTKGFQAIAAETADYTRKAFEKSSEAIEKAVQSKSFEKAFEVQQAFAKDAYEAFVAQSTKVGEMWSAATRDAYKPFEAKFAQFGVKAPK